MAALCALFAALALVPLEREGDAANAVAEPCGPLNANRASLRLDNTARTPIAPCVADVALKLKVPKSGCSFFLGTGSCDIKWNVNGINIVGQESVKMADGTSRNLWHISFEGFTVQRNLTMTSIGGTGYTLNITPDSAAVLGGKNTAGQDMMTDMWVSSTSNIHLQIAPTVGLNCNTTWTLGSAGGLLSILPEIDILGCAFDMDVYYLISYNPVADVDNQSGNYPIRLPNTSITLS